MTPMLTTTRRQYTAEFKAGIVLEILSGKATAPELAKRHRIKDSITYGWRREVVDRLPLVFAQRPPEELADPRIADLERLIGQKAVEIEALKKPRGFRAGCRGQTRNRQGACSAIRKRRRDVSTGRFG